MNNLLVFVRPFPKVEKLVSLYGKLEGTSIKYISDFAGVGDYSLIEFQHESLDGSREIYDCDYEEIISRDRFLVYQDFSLAKKLIDSAWEYLCEVIPKGNFKLFVGLPIDNYILHLIILACKKFNIPYLIPDYSPVPGYIRFWDIGHQVVCREPMKSEVEKVRDLLARPNFKPSWLSREKSFVYLTKLFLKEKLRKVYFNYLKMKSGMKYTFHYNCVYPLGENYAERGIETIFARRFFQKDFDFVASQTSGYNKVAYFPLQFTPESSLNYAIPSGDFAIYKNVVEKLLNSLPDDVFLIVKEHPDFYGLRDSNFYKLFLGRKNVSLVDVYRSNDDIYKLSDFVVTTGSSSVGIEAVIKGKKVISLGGAYYGRLGHVYNLYNLNTMRTNLSEAFRKSSVVEGENLDNFVELILQSSLPGIYDYEYKVDISDEQHIETIRKIVKCGINKDYDFIPFGSSVHSVESL